MTQQQVVKVERELAGKTISIESGRMAKLAHGSALVQCGETIVLVASCRGRAPRGFDFFPLTVDYREKTSAAGKFPGGFIKREGRPTTKEILTMRLIDRSIRPLFPKGYKDEVQVMATVLSVDEDNDPDLLAMIGAYASLAISDIPFGGPLGAVKVGRVEGQLLINPKFEDLTGGDLNLTVAGSRKSITMVEAGANEVAEDDMVTALEQAHEAIQVVLDMIDELQKACGKPKIAFEAPQPDAGLIGRVKEMAFDRITEAIFGGSKSEAYDKLNQVKADVVAELASDSPDDGKPTPAEVEDVIGDLRTEIVRGKIVDEGIRTDGRGPAEVRPITIEVGLLPRVHGSALFTRGETQALVMTTLGTMRDDQVVEGLMEDFRQKFMLHYNFPPFSVGETRPIRGPGRREIGHGALAERALLPVIPRDEAFPYTLRLISDVLESNGSSSMASVCGGTLALMDAAVPIKRPVAGIAMGLVIEGDKEVVLTDILGSEDHLGDMDFKVAGTQKGITALQMDVKISGVSSDLMRRALQQAHEGRMHILRKMLEVLEAPREKVSQYAPRMVIIKINPERIGDIIGPGGKIVRSIQEKTGCKIDIEDDGTVMISAPAGGDEQACRGMIEAMVGEIEVGSYYTGPVTGVRDFGAFVEIVPGRDGMVHVSELSDGYVKNPADVVKVGDVMKVKVIAVDDQNRIKLSHKAVLLEERGETYTPSSPSGGGGGGGRGRR